MIYITTYGSRVELRQYGWKPLDDNSHSKEEVDEIWKEWIKWQKGS